MPLPSDIVAYHAALSPSHRRVCGTLARAIERVFAGQPGAERKIWHRHPVWFLDGNPIVGYSVLKSGGDGGCVRLMFWSGRSFDEPGLTPAPPNTRFQTAAAQFCKAADIPEKDLRRWLKKSIDIQWDYKNIVKRKGRLERLK